MASLTAEQEVSTPVMTGSWLTLTFIHWRVAADRLQPLLPEGLTVDEADGSAWVGLTPFLFADMRPPGLPGLLGPVKDALGRLPGVGNLAGTTPETNLRTYVRGPDGRDGLWLFSLDIGSAALATALRAAVGAPYEAAELAVEERGETVHYTGSRQRGEASYRLVVRPGTPVSQPSDLEVWLTGRWRAYTRRGGQLLATPVEHEPWPLRKATVETLEQNLTDAAGLEGLDRPALVHFSEGVRQVRVGAPRVLGQPSA